ncbi:MAG TPA: hypothetical protein VK256_13230 [Candidatus Eisenbacteria bacterium]|nr:hypothetical protein [Candidatus Eisenbacteria bacterium]
MPSAGDQVELDSADAKAVRDDFPAAALEIPHRVLFTGEPSLMTRIGPVRWITMNAAGHSDKVRALPAGQ